MSALLASLLVALQALQPGSPLERELAGGQSHVYTISLASGDLLAGAVEQLGVDVVVVLTGPDGAELEKIDSPNGTKGPEPILTIVPAAGEYRVEVRSLEKAAPAGRYRIAIEPPRAATDRDRTRIEARRAQREAAQLLAKRTAESMPAGIAGMQKAVELFRAAGDRSGEAEALTALGRGLSNTGEKGKALERFLEALEIRRALGDRRGEADLVGLVGSTHLVLADRAKALDHFTRALAMRRELGDLPQVAELLNNIGVVYDQQAEREKALDYYEQALAALEAAGDRRNASVMLNNIGSSYSGLGDKAKAKDYMTRALALARDVKYPWAEANALMALGTLHARLGDEANAFSYCEQALAVRRTMGDRIGMANALNYIGYLYAATGKNDKSLAPLEEGLALFRALKIRRGEASSLQNLGLAYTARSEPLKALEQFAMPLAFYRETEDLAGEAGLLVCIAEAERDAGRLVEARASIEKSLDIYERLRARIGSQGLRASYFATLHAYYELYIDILMRLYRLDPAGTPLARTIETSERARARTLIELIAESRADIRQGVEPALLAEEHAAEAEIAARSGELTGLLNRKSPEEQVAAARRELAAASSKLDAVQARIRTTSPRYAAVAYPATLSLGEIQSKLLDPDTALVEYFVGKDRGWVWAVTRTGLTVHELPARKEIDTAARRVYELLTARNRRVKFEAAAEREARVAAADAEYPKAAAALSELVLGPVAKELGAKRLVVVPDGALHYVPFAALPAPGGGAYRPLVADREVVNLPSASALALLRDDVAGRAPAPGILAVVADPVFDAADDRVRAAARTVPRPAPLASLGPLTRAARDVGDEGGPRLGRLPFTRREAEAILDLVPASRRMQALDFAASRETVTSPSLGRYRYVHLATHGLLDSENPELSGLVFSLVDAEGRARDGYLRTHDLFNMSLPADLVVLSGCRTGLGHEIRGEGLVGLTRGLFYAGAARALVSVWDVPDDGTAELMARVYRELLGKQRRSPAAALRAAQLSMLGERRWQAPYYWAAFVLHGEPK